MNGAPGVQFLAIKGLLPAMQDRDRINTLAGFHIELKKLLISPSITAIRWSSLEG